MGSPKSGMQTGYGGGMGGGGGQRLANQESHRPMQHSSGLVHGSGHGPGPGQAQGHGPGMGAGMGGGPGQHGQSPGQPGQHASRRNLQVDFSGSGGRTGRSSSMSPDRGITPTSPYSVPQIAPMPVSKLCPLCSTTELNNPPALPNYNTCTQCRSTVCNQCGFNPNPHLTEVQEWLCLNCQMQRALGIDMTTARSKSQPQIHSPSHQAKPIHIPYGQRGPGGPGQPRIPHPGAVPLVGMAKAPSQPDLGRGIPMHQGGRQAASAGSSPAHRPSAPQGQPPQDGLTKLFGFGASLLNQAASTLASVDPLSGPPSSQPSPARGGPANKQEGPPGAKPFQTGGPHAPQVGGSPLKQQQQQPAARQEPAPKPVEPEKPKVNCPLCKTELNIGNTAEPPNYTSCTQCHAQVCNLCGFNPAPHLEKREWLCLNCQTQRLMSGGLGDPSPVPHPSPKHQPMGSPRHLAPASQQPQSGDTKAPVQPTPSNEPPKQPKATEETMPKSEELVEPAIDTKLTQKKGEPITKDLKKSRHYDETKNSTQDLSRSPQSLSDTGYSSDGISSSHSEITGLIQEEEMKLSERGISGRGSPPSPSEITKLESSMRPLLESKTLPAEERERERGRGRHHREQRPRSLSITPEAYDSDEELEDIVEEEEDGGDWESKREHKSSVTPKDEKKVAEPVPMTDEEFMRRQIMEMSADEDNEEEEDMEEEDEEDEGYGYQKPKKTHKHISESMKEKRRLSHHSSSFEEETKSSSDIYKGSAEEGEEGGLGGLRRFKTIELNNTNSYSHDMELNNENDLSLDREPELEMESLTGSPEERSRGEYSSTLPPTTSSYNSGTSPTSISSMEDDSDSSPSRRQRLEDAKQQRKARHRSHGSLLPTIEDSSEEDELREEEELLREQEKMRDLEQQRIRSTARKTKRDKEELRAQRRRERSKTPPSNLSPIEDASPTEELRQAAEMEELHRSSASEYSPQSLDSEAEGYESKLYKSGSEYNLPTFMSLYSPTEKSLTTTTITAPSSSKPLKSAEEVYEEMMRKAELLQKQQKPQQHQKQQKPQQQQKQQQQQGRHNSTYKDDTNGQQYEDEYEYKQAETGYENEATETGDIYEEIRQTSQNITKMHQSSALELQQQADDQVEVDNSTDKQLLDTGSAFTKLLEQTNDLLTPGTSPTQLSAPVSFSETGGRIPDVRVTQHYSKGMKSQTGKNGITPVAVVTTIAAYGVYSRDAVTISQTSVSQTMTTTQSTMYGRQTGGPTTSTTTVSNVCSKIAEITQAYSQREVVARSVGENRGVQVRDSATSSEHVIETRSPKMASYYKSSSPPLSPSASPTESLSRSPSRRVEISTQTFSPGIVAPSAGSGPTSPVMVQGTQTSHRVVSPRLFRQQSSQDSHYMDTEHTSPAKPVTVNTATSPLSSPTRFSRQLTLDGYSPQASPPDSPPYHQSPHRSFYRMQKVEKVNVGTSMVTTASTYSRGSMSMDNISLCRISTVPGTSRVEQGQMIYGGSVVDLRTVDLRTATIPAPIIMTDHGMDLTSLATETRKYTSGHEGSHPSTIIQPLIMNLNTQQHPHVMVSTATTVSVTVAASMFISQPQQPMVYGDPLQNRVDLGQGLGSAMCLSQNKPPPTDPSIPKIDAKLEDLSRYNLPGQMTLLKKDLLVSQTSNSPAMVSAISSAVAPDIYSTGGPLELKSKPMPGVMNLAGGGPHGMMVQMNGAPQGGPVTQLVKTEKSQDAVDLTGGQIKAENQPACCDVVYRLPFGGSCVGGPFSQKQNVDETVATQEPRPPSAPPLSYESDQEGQYQDISMDGRKAYTLPYPGRLQPSMSDTNLAEAGLQSYHSKMDPHITASGELAVDLSTMKHAYEGGFLGLGMQYGSYTDLRHGGDLTATALPIRRFNSLSNISSDYGYSPRDLANFQESNLAQYSATTAREISRMCAALNLMDRYGSNPELVQYGVGRGTGPGGRLNSMRQNMLYGPDGKPISQTQALTNMINARQASLRAMYPSAMRSADGMTYSTINTPIASTLPITTQPASVLCPLLRGVYRPLPTANMTPVPLASLTRMPVNPRMPLSGQAPYRYPAPNIFPFTTSASVSMPAAITTTQDAPVYLGKPSVKSGASDPSSQPLFAHTSAPVSLPTEPQQQPMNLTQPPPSGPPSSSPVNTATETEERMQRQHEQLLQMERERVELEKLRQLRLQEELERERMELQRHREKEQMLVHREIQELQTIKEQVLQQQQAERESQLVMQKEQLAQQKAQLDQIQSLQQQLQQQLEEQRRQKTAAAAAAATAAAQVVQNGQTLLPYGDQVGFISLPNSSSDMCLRNNEEHIETRTNMRRQNSTSMPRLRDGMEGESIQFYGARRIVDSCVQTDEEDGEERYIMSRRRRNRRSVDCSVQTDDDEEKVEWEQPVRRRRSRFSKHLDPGAENKTDIASKTAASSSIAIQTIRDSSCQTETNQLGKVSPAIHVTVPDPNKVEIIHYISGPERTQKGQSLACQTDVEAQSQGVVVPQLSVPTTVSPYSTSIQLVGSADPRQQQNRRRPDPLEISYQTQPMNHLHNESLSSLIRQPPKSPQVLYSPVSPVSPHRLLETSLSSGGLNKAHVTPQQKAYTVESPQRHPSIPRPIKSTQRSMSDPKPLSPTTDETTKARLNLYQQQALQSQLAALQQSALRKVKRTLPSPPPEESHLPIITPALPQMYMPSVPSLRAGTRPGLAAKASLLKDLTHELKAVEQESTKLRKQQQELEEEEKEIDAKLRYLELGIHQRKETLVKERERRDMAYLRCMGDPRDYMSDSELNNLRTAPMSQFTSDFNTAAQFPPTSSFVSYQSYHTLSQPAPAPAPQPGTPYQTGFQHAQPGQPPYPTHTSPYPSQVSYPAGPAQITPYQPQVDILTVHQRPRQTSLADLEHKMPTNYEVVSNPTVGVTTTAQDTIYSSSSGAPPYGQYTGVDSPSTYAQDGLYGPASLEQNVPRNYVMCDDISELTKEGLGGTVDMHRSDGHGGRYAGESGPARGGSSYGRPEDELTREEDLYEHHSRGKSSYHPRGSDTYGRVVGSSSTSMGGGSSYYYDDYTKHGAQRPGVQKHASKSLAPAVMSSKRSKHRKQGEEQKISKFSPIEEARDVEADLASYAASTSGGASFSVASRARKLQDDMAHGLRKSAYEQKRYSYPEERMYYTSGRSRSTGYGMDKISSRDYAGYRSRSYERDGDKERSSYRASYSRGRPPMRSQYSSEESPLSPMGVHVRASSLGPELYDSRSSQYYGQYDYSHSMPDVQDHMRDLPRTHVYKPDNSYIIDDMHCAVSDSEAYHLGQEETDWFEKPRDLRSSSRHYGSGGHSSSGRSRHVKHTYHDYDEPPEEDLWPQDEYGHSRQSSTSRDHRHHGSTSSGRHSASSRHSDEPRTSRSSKGHPKDPSMRHDSRQMSSSGKRGDPRSQGGYHSSDYSRDPSGHHHSQGRSSKSSSSHDGRTSSRKQQELQGHPPSSSRGQGSSGRVPGSAGGPPGSRGQGPTYQQDGLQQGQRTQLQQQPQTLAARQTGTTPAGTTPGGQQPLGLAQAQQGLQAKPGQLGPGQAGRQPQAGGPLGQLPLTAVSTGL
uniref:Zinc finger piccolo-type domain-containing protein n=1 Tax=Oncorhynchus tshawytscha TaxID=74940 RepID=A0AAZ3PJW0_ONCTS